MFTLEETQPIGTPEKGEGMDLGPGQLTALQSPTWQ
jgi:hypothetical protein